MQKDKKQSYKELLRRQASDMKADAAALHSAKEVAASQEHFLKTFLGLLEVASC
jgi:hypothetical protein